MINTFRVWAIFIVLLVVFGLVILLAGAAQKEGLVVTPKRVDLGKVASGTKIPFVINAVNTSDTIITVKRIRKSCTCTDVIPNESTEIPPGGVLKITGMVKTKGLIAKQATTLYVETDCKDTPLIRVDVALYVAVTCSVFPEALNFASIPPHAISTKKLIIHRRDSLGLKVRVQDAPKWATVTSYEFHQYIVFDVSIKPDREEGEGVLILATNIKTPAIIEVPLKYSVDVGAYPSPQMLLFDLTKESEANRQKNLSIQFSEDWRFNRFEAPSGWEIVTKAKGQWQVRYIGDNIPLAREETLKLYLNNGDGVERVKNIPLCVICAQ